MQRSEEELRAGVREREAGRVNARKSVSTEREVVRVPKRREEVSIERVPVEGEAREASGATEADIGEDEVVLQVFEEEVVVTKRVVLKEEIRLRKRVAGGRGSRRGGPAQGRGRDRRSERARRPSGAFGAGEGVDVWPRKTLVSGSRGTRSTTSTTRRSARSTTSSWTRTTCPSTSASRPASSAARPR